MKIKKKMTFHVDLSILAAGFQIDILKSRLCSRAPSKNRFEIPPNELTSYLFHAMSRNLYLPIGFVLNRIEFEIGDDPATF